MMKPSRARRATLIRLGVVGVSVGLVGVAACDGPNRFTGPGIDGGGGAAGAPTVDVTEVRSSVPVGDSLLVKASARDGSGIVSLAFHGRTLRGDPDLGTDQSVDRFESRTVSFEDSPTDTTVSRFLQPVPGDDTRETTWIVVEATDEDGNVGVDSVAVIVGGPAVEFLNLAAPQSGTDLPIQVRASDPDGVASIRVNVGGAMDTVLLREFSPVEDSVALDTLLFIPGGLTGTLEVMAEAANTRGVSGFTAVRSLEIAQGGGADNVPPSLTVTAESPRRLEIQSNVTVSLIGRDNVGGSGVRTAGMTVLGISPSRSDTLLHDTTVTFARPRSGTVAQEFLFSPFNVDSLAIPDTLIYEVTGYFVDESGNCAAATASDEEGSLPCTNLSVSDQTGVVAQGIPGQRLEREIVSGRTVLLPAGGRVMDAAVDTLRENLFLSNIDRNRIEVFRLPTQRFAPAIGVGSAPWGLALVNDFSLPDPDSLVVANSNGTNLELVDLDQEVARPEERFFFSDVVMFDVKVDVGESGINVDVTATPDLGRIQFSDRPQYIAVDTFGNRIFSTLAVDGADEIGTVRKSFFLPGWEQPETKIFVEHALTTQAEDAFALAHVDAAGANGSVLTVVDHTPGFPDDLIVVQIDFARQSIADVAPALEAAGSDAVVRDGNWDFGSVGFEDTTYVAASGDGTMVVIGEGAQPEQARVLLHEAGPSFTTNLTGSIRVGDLITNRPGPVRGIGLNYDGTLGVVRGDEEVAFFDSGLRKQGGVVLPGGSGAALHPLHVNQKTLFNLDGVHSPDTHLAFVGSGDGTIDIIDTFRFLRIGSIRIRDVITGPLRAVLPFDSDNEDFTCSEIVVRHPDSGEPIGTAVQLYEGGNFNAIVPNSVTDERCVVVKLFAVTDVGGVVVVDVRKGDVLRFHPQRR